MACERAVWAYSCKKAASDPARWCESCWERFGTKPVPEERVREIVREELLTMVWDATMQGVKVLTAASELPVPSGLYADTVSVMNRWCDMLIAAWLDISKGHER